MHSDSLSVFVVCCCDPGCLTIDKSAYCIMPQKCISYTLSHSHHSLTIHIHPAHTFRKTLLLSITFKHRCGQYHFCLVAFGPADVETLQAAFGNKVSPHELQLYFGPNEAVMGVQYQNDPAVDESKLKLSQFSFLPWLQV